MPSAQAPDFTLRQLSYLLAVADTGTLSAAAAASHVSASAISDAISDLERTLATTLCIRRRAHGVTMTATGRRVVERARPILAAARELRGSLHGSDGELVGPITIGCYPTLAPVVLPPLLHDFGRAHPRVELNIFEATQDQLAGGLESGEVDLAFVYDMLVPGATRRRKLYDLAAHVLVSESDALAREPAVRLEDLVDRDLILLDAPPSSAHTLSLFAARGLVPHVRHRTRSYEVVRTLVGRGLGYGILVQRPANPASYEGYPVVMKDIEPPVEPVGIDVIWPAVVDPPPRVHALIEFARSIRWTPAERP